MPSLWQRAMSGEKGCDRSPASGWVLQPAFQSGSGEECYSRTRPFTSGPQMKELRREFSCTFVVISQFFMELTMLEHLRCHYETE